MEPAARRLDQTLVGVSPAMQAKLLRLLERHEMMPMGSLRAVSVDLRVIEATNEQLQELVAARRFWPDLFYRLNVAPIALPPLKERKEDIPLLFAHATRSINQRGVAAVRGLDEELLDCLMPHDRPDSVRELHNMVEAVVVDSPRGRVALSHLPLVFQEMIAAYHRTSTDECQRMLAALDAKHWNKAQAANRLKSSRMTLYRKLGKYGRGDGDPR